MDNVQICDTYVIFSIAISCNSCLVYSSTLVREVKDFFKTTVCLGPTRSSNPEHCTFEVYNCVSLINILYRE
jgi:hypothetical protein